MSDEYRDAVLDDAPILFWRLDETGASSNNDEIEDISGEDNHGTLADTTGNAYGWPSPIETDASSKSFRARRLTADGDSRIELSGGPSFSTGAVTLECWVYSLEGVGSGFGDGLFGRSQELQIRRTFEGSPATGAANFRLALRATRPDLSFDEAVAGIDIYLNTWYHVVGVRNGPSLAIYIFGIAAGVGTTVSGALNASAQPLTVGTSAALVADVLIDECAAFDSALSSARALAHYNAARIRAAISGRSDARPTASLSSEREAEPLTLSVRHNWSELFVERLTWATGVGQARAGAEEAAGANLTPRRELEYSPLLRNDRERRRFHARAYAGQGRRFYVPYEPDKAQAQAALAASATSIPVDTQYRDYEIGGFVNVYQLGDDGVIETEEVRTITSVSPSALGIDALVNSYDAYKTFVRPARRGYLPKSISLRGHTGAVEDLTLSVRLLAEDEPITPNRVVEWAPTLSYKGYEVFDPAEWQSNDWSEAREYDIEREAEDVDSGRGLFSVFSDTPNAQGSFTYRMALEGREYIARLLGWFYARAGRKNYLWVPTMQSDLEIVSAASDDLTVEGHDYTEGCAGLESRQDIAFVYTDNSMTLRRIGSAAASGSNDVLDLDANVPSLTNLRFVSYLKFCRLDADAVEIAWHTDSVAAFAWRFRELITAPD